VLFSLEIAATALLLGAQVISEYERVGKGETHVIAKPIKTA
jgi:membrane protein